jgi:hypothetical protein
MANGMVEVC